MKKLMNDPSDFVDEMLDGLVAANRDAEVGGGDGAGRASGRARNRQGGRRLGRRLRSPAALHRLRRQRPARHLLDRQRLRRAESAVLHGGDPDRPTAARRASALRQLRRRPHELRHGRRDAGGRRTSRTTTVLGDDDIASAPARGSAPSAAASPASSTPTRPPARSPRPGLSSMR